MSAKNEMIERIKRRLGYPVVKVELDDDQISDNIERARERFIKFAVGQATQEVYFTVMLSAGQYLYQMPGGVVEVVSYDIQTSGKINTLFTVEHYLYEGGMFNLLNPAGSGYSLISYHIARDFLELLDRYMPDAYNFKYHKKQNILEIQPPPLSGSYLTIGDTTFHSPGFILVRAYMIAGASLTGFDIDDENLELYDSRWIEDYSLALSMITLGYIRRKFASFGAMGNVGTALDGDAMVSEGKAEIDRLETLLDSQESYIGYPIFIG